MVLKKCAKRKRKEEEDRFKQLPATVLGLILSFLPLKEAAATSILSKFWRRIWLFSEVLDFDASKVLKHPPGEPPCDTPERVPEPVNWIFKALRSHRLATHGEQVLKKLRIHTQLNMHLQLLLAEWISYASECKVQILELDFTFGLHPKFFFFQQCWFPLQIVLTSLRSLSLAAVDITGEGVLSLLRNSPLLRSLTVRRSGVLGRLEVCGPSLALEHLEVSYCTCVSLIVRDTSLVSLTVTHMKADGLTVENNPKLVVIHAADFCRGLGLFNIGLCFSKLELLTYSTYFSDLVKPCGPTVIPFPFTMKVMKKLTLMVDPLLQDSVLLAYNLLCCYAPKLEKFVLEFVYHSKRKTWQRSKRKGDLSKWHPRFRRVKVFEVRGYYGGLEENEVLEFILKHYVAPPQKVVFDLHNSGREMYRTAQVRREDEPVQLRRSEDERVEQLRSVVPPTAEFIVA